MGEVIEFRKRENNAPAKTIEKSEEKAAEDILSFDKEKLEEAKKNRSIAEQISDIDIEIKNWQHRRNLLKERGPMAFEGDDREKSKTYIQQMGICNIAIQQLSLKMRELAKELELK